VSVSDFEITDQIRADDKTRDPAIGPSTTDRIAWEGALVSRTSLSVRRGRLPLSRQRAIDVLLHERRRRCYDAIRPTRAGIAN
jgi:hypothetical protein